VESQGRRPPGVAVAAEKLLENLDTWAARATEIVLGAIPSYREHEEELERSVRYTMRTFVDYAHSGVAPTEVHLARLGDVGRRRAESRIPLADVLHAFRVSARTLLSGLATGPDGLSAETVLWVAEALFGYIDTVSNRVTHRYIEAQADLLRAEDARRREFFSDLVHGYRSPADALTEASALGIELLGESRVMVIGPADSDVDLPDAADRQVEEAFAPTPVLSVRIGGDLVVLPLGPADPEIVADRVDGVVVGEGRIHPGLEGIRQSYAEARESLAIARATGAGPVARFLDLVLDRLLRQDPALLAEFVAQTVGAVQAYDSRRATGLLETLNVWAEEGGSPTAAAERLRVHPHTIAYRLSRIEELTGLSLARPGERMQLLLGLRASRLHQGSFVSPTKSAPVISPANPGEIPPHRR